MEEFVYWRHPTPAGIKVEEISGGEGRSARVWEAMARQIYCENGKDDYRQLDHFDCGAPYLEGEDTRISITHCKGLMAVATLPRTPEADLSQFNTRTAMGIDAETEDRGQVLKVREKFLSDAELDMIPADDVERNIQAWTAKEALLKAGMDRGVDIRVGLVIETLPEIGEISGFEATADFGKGMLRLADGREEPMSLYSWRSEGCILTLAFSPKCAKFKA